jgi:hypothetical protein
MTKNALNAFKIVADVVAKTLIDKSYYASLAVEALLTNPFTHNGRRIVQSGSGSLSE